jgi:LysM repeat protein/ABC-type branched-subunit amino acid transport system substrate-binding protein
MIIGKKNNYLFLLVLLFHAAFFFSQNRSSIIQVQDGRKFYIHKIEKSQSLYSISKLYSVSIEELYDLNPELKAGPKVNQEIRIPFVAGAISTPASATATNIDSSKYLTHKLMKGETIYSICRKYNISERQLAIYNPSLDQGLKEGQVIIVGEKVKKKTPVKENKETKVQANLKEQKPALSDSAQLKILSKPKKSKYQIALALPFRLDQTLAMDLGTTLKTNSSFPNVPALAVDFYLGFKKAVDSLVGEGFEIKTELYDVDDKDSLKLAQFVNENKFKDHDFIFGPLYANGFKSIAKKAKEYHIPIVSPITQQNKILYNNVFISKTNPSQFTLIESLAEYCVDSLIQERTNILLLAAAEKDKKEIAFVQAFKKHFLEKQRAGAKLVKDSIRVVKGIEGVKAAYVPNVKNVVINLSNNQVLISDFITQLAVFKNEKDIVLCGWASNSTYDNIDQEYLNELHYTFPYQFNLIDSTYNPSLIANYMNQQGTYPSEYYFMGFDIAYYYLSNLKQSGPDFIHHLNDLPREMDYMRFEFNRPDNSTGFDNSGVYIYRYRNYKLHKTGWK